jgi:hypothetical protein
MGKFNLVFDYDLLKLKLLLLLLLLLLLYIVRRKQTLIFLCKMTRT